MGLNDPWRMGRPPLEPVDPHLRKAIRQEFKPLLVALRRALRIILIAVEQMLAD